MKDPQKTVCWVVTDDGKPGTENQVLGLAYTMGLTPVVKRVALRFPWRYVSPPVTWGARHSVSVTNGHFQPPWPDIVLSAGRAGMMGALAVKQQSQDKPFMVHVLDPRINPSHFDVVIASQHDRVRGHNVLVTTGALHRVTPDQAATAAAQHTGPEAQFPPSRVAVLIGGQSKNYRLSPSRMVKLVNIFAHLIQDFNASLMIVTSRRTGDQNREELRQWTAAFPQVRVWDGHGDNPYLAYLGLADIILVTEDSVSMLSEACSLGKPVYVLPLDGGSAKFRAFHQALYDHGCARPFTGTLEAWPAKALNDTAHAAEYVWKRYSLRQMNPR